MNVEESPTLARDRRRVLTLATAAFTALFAVWLMLGVLAVPIRAELGLSEVQVGWLTAVAVLNGALFRLAFGIWTDRIGGRVMMTALLLATAIPCALVSRAETYGELLLAAALYGFAGNGFSVGVAWCSAWYPPERQGFALGIFGAGNVGASVTKLAGPVLIALVTAPLLGGLVPAGWRAIPVLYAALLVVFAAFTWFLAPAQDRRPGRGRSLRATLVPLRELRVWRFSLYYVVVFGAYVALSVWLPKYYVDVYGLPLKQAALLTALFIFPASLLRPLGGYLSDRLGARGLMAWVLAGTLLASALLSLPTGVGAGPGLLERGGPLGLRLGVAGFTVLVLVIGVAMGVGKAAVFKYIPQYYPRDVGAVGGLVGLLGALGGFVLPLVFAYLKQGTGYREGVFLVLALLALWSLVWQRRAIAALTRPAARARLATPREDEVEEGALTGAT